VVCGRDSGRTGCRRRRLVGTARARAGRPGLFVLIGGELALFDAATVELLTGPAVEYRVYRLARS